MSLGEYLSYGEYNYIGCDPSSTSQHLFAAMGESPRHHRYSRSPSPCQRYSISRSPVRRDNGGSSDALNPGNNLYVAGLSVRVTERDLEDLFSQEGKVIEYRLVVDPRTRESRGFGFVTMDTLEDAERCVKYLHHSTFQGRIITVEKAKRRRARTPTPGEYLGVRAVNRSRQRGYRRDYDRNGYSSRRSPNYPPYRDGRNSHERSPHYSPYHGAGGHRRERSLSPQYSPYQR